MLSDPNLVKKKRIVDHILGHPRRQGHEYLYESRCCGHHKKKLSVNFAKNAAKCWVCDWKTNNLRRLVRRWGNFKHVRDWKEFDSDMEVGELETIFQKEPTSTQRIDLPPEFKTLSGGDHPKTSLPALKYLKDRGVTKEDILYWKVGYCSSGEYANRIILPSFSEEGYCNYFTARTYEKKIWPPYLNGPGSKDIIFNDLLIDWETEVILVEGVFDAIVAEYNAIPLLGSTLREDSLLFKKIVLNDTPVLLGLDHDAQKKAMRLIKAMLAHDIEVRFMDTSGYKDIGEMPREVFEERKQEAAFIDSDTYLLKIALLA